MNVKSKLNKNKKIMLAWDIFLAGLLISADQITKYLAVIRLRHQPAYVVINEILEFNYLENRGAAFGVLQNQKVLFIFVSLIFLSVICYLLYHTPPGKKYIVMHLLLTTIAGGAIGNMIDRISYGYVVDFIYLSFINFPIFNLADLFVTTATIILLYLLLFYYKEQDLDFLNFKQNKYRVLNSKTP